MKIGDERTSFLLLKMKNFLMFFELILLTIVYIQILQPFNTFQSKSRSLGFKSFLCAKNGYLASSCKLDGYLARFAQAERLSCKILESRMVILQDE